MKSALTYLAFAAGFLLAGNASANSDPLTGVAGPGGGGIGAVMRYERSPYRGAGTQRDFLPLYLYEGQRLYMHTYGIGLRFGGVQAGASGSYAEPRYDVFLRRRFEGSPYDRIPESLAGM